jgi:hypothetical protein
MFIFIDELDRCRPTYSIAMLERIKHLFDVDGVVFVLATDATQLSHSIKAVYGSEFDSKRYLQRFFSRTYKLPTPPIGSIVDALIKNGGVDKQKWQLPDRENRENAEQDFVGFVTEASKYFGLSIRGVEQALDILFDVTTIWEQKFPIQIALMYPMICEFIRNNGNVDFGMTDGQYAKRIAALPKHWGVDYTSTKSVSFKDYIGSLYTAGSADLHEQLEESQRVISVNPEYNPRGEFIYKVLKEEWFSRFGPNFAANQRSAMSEYPNLIKHAQRLNLKTE